MKHTSPSDTVQVPDDPEHGSHARQARKSPRRWVRILLPAILILAWLTGAAVGGPYFGKVDEVSSNDQTTFLPESAELRRFNNFKMTSPTATLFQPSPFLRAMRS